MKNLSMKKTVLAVALTAAMGFGSTSVMALVLNPFTVDEGSVPGTGAIGSLHTNAGGFTGNYTEVATFDGAGNFATSIRWTANGIYDVNNVSFSSFVNSAGAEGYKMYGLFMAVGTYLTDLSGKTTFTFSPGGSLSLFIDPDNNSIVNGGGIVLNPTNGSTPWTVHGTTSDDYEIASGVTVGGEGTLDPNLTTCGGFSNNCGSFGVNTTFNLTNPNGPLYFTAPSPFYSLSFNSGQLKDFSVAGTQVISGSLDVNFANRVPEPGTIALLGFGLLGMSMARRGRKQGINQA